MSREPHALLVIAQLALQHGVGRRAYEAPRLRLEGPRPEAPARAPALALVEPDEVAAPAAGSPARPVSLPTESYLELRAATANHRRRAYALYI